MIQEPTDPGRHLSNVNISIPPEGKRRGLTAESFGDGSWPAKVLLAGVISNEALGPGPPWRHFPGQLWSQAHLGLNPGSATC